MIFVNFGDRAISDHAIRSRLPLARKDVQAKLRLEFMEVVASTPQAFAATISEDVARWKPVIESRKIEQD